MSEVTKPIILDETGQAGVQALLEIAEILNGSLVTIKGADGKSVTVTSVNESTADGGSNVITFSDGTTVTVKNGSRGGTGATGATGSAGKDGVSPTISTSSITGGHRLSITDKNGSRSVDVMDGKDGAAGKDGSAGKNGVSPTVSIADIDGGHRVTITDAAGTKTFDVMDGVDGEDATGGGLPFDLEELTTEQVVLPTTTVTNKAANLAKLLDPFIVGQTYVLTINGTDYTCVCESDSKIETTIGGFQVYVSRNKLGFTFYHDGMGQTNVDVAIAATETTHQVPAKNIAQLPMSKVDGLEEALENGTGGGENDVFVGHLRQANNTTYTEFLDAHNADMACILLQANKVSEGYEEWTTATLQDKGTDDGGDFLLFCAPFRNGVFWYKLYENNFASYNYEQFLSAEEVLPQLEAAAKVNMFMAIPTGENNAYVLTDTEGVPITPEDIAMKFSTQVLYVVTMDTGQSFSFGGINMEMGLPYFTSVGINPSTNKPAYSTLMISADTGQWEMSIVDLV